MAVCTFFGHYGCPSTVKSRLQTVLIDLIERYRVDKFLYADLLLKGTPDKYLKTVTISRLRIERGVLVGAILWAFYAIVLNFRQLFSFIPLKNAQKGDILFLNSAIADLNSVFAEKADLLSERKIWL